MELDHISYDKLEALECTDKREKHLENSCSVI